MRSTLVLFLLGACAACGTTDSLTTTPQPKPPEQGTHIDKDLQRFVDDFMRDCEARRTDCAEKMSQIDSIRITEIPDLDTKDNEYVIGLCHDRPFNKYIEINKEIMSKSDWYIKTLLYHEIGHCAYDLDHDAQENTLMSPLIPPLYIIIRDWQLMLGDFFSAIYEKHGD
jgi:hypothetical protein